MVSKVGRGIVILVIPEATTCCMAPAVTVFGEEIGIGGPSTGCELSSMSSGGLDVRLLSTLSGTGMDKEGVEWETEGSAAFPCMTAGERSKAELGLGWTWPGMLHTGYGAGSSTGRIPSPSVERVDMENRIWAASVSRCRAM